MDIPSSPFKIPLSYCRGNFYLFLASRFTINDNLTVLGNVKIHNRKIDRPSFKFETQ